MKISNNKLELITQSFEGNGTFNTLMTSKDLAVRLSFQLAKLAKELSSLFEVYFAEKNKLIKKYADKDKDGNPIEEKGQYKITDKKFMEEFQILLKQESNLNIEKVIVYPNELPAGLLSPNELLQFEDMLEFKEMTNDG